MTAGIAIAADRYGLPNPTTPEDLACNTIRTITSKYGDFIILAGNHYNGIGMPDAYGAIYENLTNEPLNAESTIGLLDITDISFEDTGHALAWAIDYINNL